MHAAGTSWQTSRSNFIFSPHRNLVSSDLQIILMTAERKTTLKKCLIVLLARSSSDVVKHVLPSPEHPSQAQLSGLSPLFHPLLRDRTGDVISFTPFATCMPLADLLTIDLVQTKHSLPALCRSYCTCFPISRKRVFGSRGTCHSGQTVINLRGRSIQADESTTKASIVKDRLSSASELHFRALSIDLKGLGYPKGLSHF